MLVDGGDQVKSGQLLVRLDKSKIEAQVAAATARLSQASARRNEAQAGYRREDVDAAQQAYDRATATNSESRRNFERQQRLLDQGATTRVARDQAEEAWRVAEANWKEAKARLDKMQKGPRAEELAAARADEERARAELQHAQALLSDYEIYSPIDGVVINRFRDAGETVDVGMRILAIVNPDKLRIWAEVEETDAGLVEVGQNVTVTVDAHPGKEFKGKVTKVYAAVQRKSQKTFDPAATFDINTQKIEVALDDYNGLVHGMSVSVRFLK
jgi:multidrug resistance efflux pump